MQKKILLTGSKWMLATEFLEKFSDEYKIFWFDSDEMDITKSSEIEKKIFVIQPDLVLNLAAYTNVDDAEDIWEELNLAVNSDWVKNLAEICWKNWIDFITISTDFVFNWEKEDWYNENDLQNPVNQYWFAKFLWEKKSTLIRLAANKKVAKMERIIFFISFLLSDNKLKNQHQELH